MPLRFAGLCMEPTAYQSLLRRRLGLRQRPAGSNCVECGRYADAEDTHDLVCRIATAKHDAAVSVLTKCAAVGGLRPRREVMATNEAGDLGRPADIYISDYSGGRALAIDVTVATAMRDCVRTERGPPMGNGRRHCPQTH